MRLQGNYFLSLKPGVERNILSLLLFVGIGHLYPAGQHNYFLY